MTVERKRPAPSPPAVQPPSQPPGSSPSFSSRARGGVVRVLTAVCSSLPSLPSPLLPRRQFPPAPCPERPALQSAAADSPPAKRPRGDADAGATQAPLSASTVYQVYLRSRHVSQLPQLHPETVNGDNGVVLVTSGAAANRRSSRRQSKKQQHKGEAGGMEVTGEQLKEEKRAPLIGKFTYKPAGSADGITITDADAVCLRPGEYLNDVMIDFYLKYVHYCLLTPSQRDRTHVFNCFFYKRLTRRVDAAAMPGASQAVRRHASVAKWTRRVDLFDKDFILVPINENCHWFLAVICFPGLVGSVNYLPSATPCVSRRASSTAKADSETAAEIGSRDADGTLRLPCILVFDSLVLNARTANVTALRDYLQVEWDTKHAERDGSRSFTKDTMRGYMPRVPQQPNTIDCGPYALHYAEMLFRRPIREFTKHYFENDMIDWFQHDEIDNKRLEMERLLVHLYQTIGPDSGASICEEADNASDLSA